MFIYVKIYIFIHTHSHSHTHTHTHMYRRLCECHVHAYMHARAQKHTTALSNLLLKCIQTYDYSLIHAMNISTHAYEFIIIPMVIYV